MKRELDFERPILALERQIDALRRAAAGRDRLANVVATSQEEAPRRTAAKRTRAKTPPIKLSGIETQIRRLEARAAALSEQTFKRLSRWQTVQVARHPERPFTLDYIGLVFSEFTELRGDRCFGDDRSIVGGLARLGGDVVMVMGHQKGRSTQENLERNFGMPRPEGYRKALRLMRLAERFRLPLVTLVDTPGAYPGIDAEERGQAQAIAEALEGMAGLEVPVVSVIIGEGGSGGALAIAVSNRVLMLEYAVYSVISPEGCASILFKDAGQAERAADALKLTAKDLSELGVVDRVIPEAVGGAHRGARITAENLREALIAELAILKRLGPVELREARYARFRSLGRMGARVGLGHSEGDEVAAGPGPDPNGGVSEEQKNAKSVGRTSRRRGLKGVGDKMPKDESGATSAGAKREASRNSSASLSLSSSLSSSASSNSGTSSTPKRSKKASAVRAGAKPTRVKASVLKTSGGKMSRVKSSGGKMSRVKSSGGKMSRVKSSGTKKADSTLDRAKKVASLSGTRRPRS